MINPPILCFYCTNLDSFHHQTGRSATAVCDDQRHEGPQSVQYHQEAEERRGKECGADLPAGQDPERWEEIKDISLLDKIR